MSCSQQEVYFNDMKDGNIYLTIVQVDLIELELLLRFEFHHWSFFFLDCLCWFLKEKLESILFAYQLPNICSIDKKHMYGVYWYWFHNGHHSGKLMHPKSKEDELNAKKMFVAYSPIHVQHVVWKMICISDKLQHHKPSLCTELHKRGM